MSFSKVNIGLRPNGTNKKSHFNLGCDSHFTSNFGRIVPIYSQELIPGSHVNLNIKSLVRLSPLAVPTVGRMHVNYYVNFVPYKEVFKPFDSLISKRPYNYTSGAAIPQSVPCYNYTQLLNLFLSNYPYKISDYDGSFGYLDTFSTGLTAVEDIKTILTSYYGSNIDGNIYFYVFDGNGNTYLGHNEDGTISLSLTDHDDVYPNSEKYDAYLGEYRNKKTYLKFGKCHRHILQILVGLGYPYSHQNVTVSILPLLSCYLSWFKLFGIERHRNIEQTSYSIIKNNLVINNDDWKNEFPQFITDLMSMYYTFAPDYFTSQVTDNANNQSENRITYNMSLTDTDSIFTSEDLGSRTGETDSGLGIVIARRLLRLVNQNTVFGASVEKYLRSLYPGIHFDKKHDVFKGSHRININVDDVFSLADTDNATLGEYAGKAIGSGNSPSYSFDCDYQGLLIIFACIVPEPGYYQATCPHVIHYEWEDFYNPEFDSLGLVPTRGFEFLSDSQIPFGQNVIGLRPRYQDYKWHPNVITGSLRSKFDEDSYRGYYLDRYFPTLENGTHLDNPNLRLLNDNYDQFNLNRIFQSFNKNDDHFIVFNVIDCNVQANMIPIEDSFVDADVEKAGNVTVSRS